MLEKINKENRVLYIDALKGFTIICVVLGHIVDGYYRSGLFIENDVFLWTIFDIIYSFHMALFFIISGYVFAAAYLVENEIKIAKIKKQILKLAYVYIIWCVLMWIAKFVMGSWANSTTTINDLILIPFKSIEPYWYLYVLIVYYFIFSMKKVWENEYKKLLVILSFISIIAAFMPIIRWFEITKMLYFALFFFIGIGIAKNKLNIDKKIILIGILSIVLFIMEYPKQIDRVGGINLICAIGISLTIFWIFRKWHRVVKKFNILLICGQHSLEIYVMHCLFTAAFRFVLNKIGINNILVSILINLVLSLIIPIGFSEIMKKLKLYNLLFNGAQCKKNSVI